jgi:hypothetical protein
LDIDFLLQNVGLGAGIEQRRRMPVLGLAAPS